MNRHELTSDDRRRGGQKSGEARRKRKLRGWTEEYLEAVEADPRSFVAGLLASGNAMTQMRALELAMGAKKSRLLEREAALDARERKVKGRPRGRQSDSLHGWG